MRFIIILDVGDSSKDALKCDDVTMSISETSKMFLILLNKITCDED